MREINSDFRPQDEHFMREVYATLSSYTGIAINAAMIDLTREEQMIKNQLVEAFKNLELVFEAMEKDASTLLKKLQKIKYETS